MKKLTLTIYLLLISVSLFAQIPESELNALKDLYQSTQGDQWKLSWPINEPVTHWEGVTITNNHVTEVRMLFNNLNGEIPSSINQLNHLKVLELSFNNISGELPESLGDIKTLEVLALNGNFIKGVIPASFGNIINLKLLHLSSNELSGEIPSTINNLQNLEVFNVFQNNLSGDLPLELSRSRILREFIVAKNNFKNTSQISKILLSHSAVVYLDENKLHTTGKPIIAVEGSDDGN